MRVGRGTEDGVDHRPADRRRRRSPRPTRWSSDAVAAGATVLTGGTPHRRARHLLRARPSSPASPPAATSSARRSSGRCSRIVHVRRRGRGRAPRQRHRVRAGLLRLHRGPRPRPPHDRAPRDRHDGPQRRRRLQRRRAVRRRQAVGPRPRGRRSRASTSTSTQVHARSRGPDIPARLRRARSRAPLDPTSAKGPARSRTADSRQAERAGEPDHGTARTPKTTWTSSIDRRRGLRPHRRHPSEGRRPAGRRARGTRPRRRPALDRRHRRRDARDRRPVGLARPGRAHRDPRRARPRDLLALPRGRERLHRPRRRATQFDGRHLPGAARDRAGDRHGSSRSSTRSSPRSTPTGPWAHPRRDRSSTRSRSPRWLEHADRRRRGAREHRHVHRRGDAHQAGARVLGAAGAAHGGIAPGASRNLVDADFILDKRVVGGLQQVPLLLAERLGDARSPRRSRCARIEWDRLPGVDASRPTPSLEVHAHARRPRACRRSSISRISYEPPLPRRQQQLHQHLSMGFVIKVHAVYETPFWREPGLSGTAFSPYELVHEAYDNTNHGDAARHARRLRLRRGRPTACSRSSRRGAQGAHPRVAVALLRRPRPSNPVVYYESDWGSEEWTRGAYAASFDMGGLARYGADLRTPVGPDPLRVQRHGGQGLPARRRRHPRRPAVADDVITAALDEERH